MTGSNRRKTAIAVVGFGAIGLGALAVVYLFPLWQTRSLRQGVEDYRNASPKPTGNDLASVQALAALEKAQLDTENAMRTSLIQAVGGTVLLVGLYFTYQNLRATQRNVEIAEDKQVTERFGKAVEMLSNASLHTRLGGIYALERIAKDSDDDYWQVMEVLTAFVREESPWPPKQGTSEGTEEVKVPDPVEALQPKETLPVEPSKAAAEGETSQGAEPPPELSKAKQRWQEWKAFLATLPPLRTDIQAVMTVIGRRKHRYEEGEKQRLNLSKTDLRNLRALDANLRGVNLNRAHLEGALLNRAHLEGTFLREAHLEGAILSEAHLEQAILLEIDLSQVFGLTKEQLDKALTDSSTILPPDLQPPDLQRRKRRPPTPVTTPSTPPPDPPAAPSTATAAPSSQPTPDPSTKSNETET